MKENYITDTFDFKIPNIENLKKEFASFKDSQEPMKFLEVEVDVTHGGYVNKNYYYYTPDGQAKGAASFIIPFQKPVLDQHIDDNTPIGRTVAAAYIPLSVPKGKENDLFTPKSKIRVKGVITDQKAIEDILTKRYLTTSTGGSAKEPPRCSICDTPIESIGPLGSMPGCEHQRGKKYKNKNDEEQLCYWNIGEMEYKEWSFVNMPADYTPQHVASIVNMRWVDTLDPQDNITMDGISEITDFQDIKDNKKEDQKNEIGGIKMPDEKKDKPLEQILDALAIIEDDCPECDEYDEEKCKEWEDEKEIGEAEELDGEFMEVINLFLAEDKKLPPAGSKARQKMKTVFCGPNKTFPIPDCKHAAVAIAMLAWPNVKKKYSASVRAKIRACVMRRAKALGCPMAKKKKDAENIKIPTDVKISTDAEVSKWKSQIEDLNTQVQEKDAQIEKANEQIKNLSERVKIRLAEKVVDLSIMAKRSSINDIVHAGNDEERETKYKDHVKSLSERSEESLKDSISDLTEEAKYTFTASDKISDPHIEDEEEKDKVIKKEDEKETKRKRVLGILWGKKE